MTLVAGIDSSTQSVEVIVCDAESGAVVREGRSPHRDGTECEPEAWWDSLAAASAGLLEGVEALAVAGQQHGMVVLDQAGQVVRPALLWNDTARARRGAAMGRRCREFVPVAAFTVTKLLWLSRAEPDHASRVARVMLPHDWLTWRLAGRPDVATTDRGDASGTGYWSPATGEYRPDLLVRAFGRDLGVPRVAGPAEVIGETEQGIALAAGTGDNMAAALGLGLASGDVVVSLGTSGTAFAVAGSPSEVRDGRVELQWPGAVTMACQSDARWMVVFDKLPDLVCIEPQTAPPGLSTDAQLVGPCSPKRATVTWSWDPAPA